MNMKINEYENIFAEQVFSMLWAFSGKHLFVVCIYGILMVISRLVRVYSWIYYLNQLALDYSQLGQIKNGYTSTVVFVATLDKMTTFAEQCLIKKI